MNLIEIKPDRIKYYDEIMFVDCATGFVKHGVVINWNLRGDEYAVRTYIGELIRPDDLIGKIWGMESE